MFDALLREDSNNVEHLALLTTKFSDFIHRHLLPSDFSDMMLKARAVFSGSAIYDFLDADTTRKWREDGVGLEDLDLYVPLGQATRVCDYLLHHKQILATSLHVENVEQFAHIKDGVNAVRRIHITKAGSPSVTVLKVIESSAGSALLPVCYLSFSHCRNALSPNGLLVFHPKWTMAKRGYGYSQKIWGLVHPIHDVVEKHRRRGFVVDMWPPKCSPPRECFTSVDCPWTTRDTEDDGVQFFPFNDSAIAQGRACVAGESSTCVWRHGGRACFDDLLINETEALFLPHLRSKV